MSLTLATELAGARVHPRTCRSRRENSRLGFRANFPRSRQAKRQRSARAASGKRARLRRTRVGATIWKKVNGTLEKQWVYGDDLRIVAELDGAGNVVSRFVWAADLGGGADDPIATLLARFGVPPDVAGIGAVSGRQLSLAPLYVLRNGDVLRFVADEIGSPRLLVDVVTGLVAERIDYEEWGTVLAGGTGFVPFGFAAGLRDGDTDLVRFGVRDYEPTLGRWTSQDPIRFDGNSRNLFTYAQGDPINRQDPKGTSVVASWLDSGFIQDVRCAVCNFRQNLALSECADKCTSVPVDQMKECFLRCSPSPGKCDDVCKPPGGGGGAGGAGGEGGAGGTGGVDGASGHGRRSCFVL